MTQPQLAFPPLPVALSQSLLIFQDVLADEPGQLWQDLGTVDSTQILTAYGAWFRSLADRQLGWQDYLLQRLLVAENPFTRQVQQTAWEQLPLALQQAVQHDLRILHQIYSCSCQQISHWVQSRTSESVVDWG